MRSFIFPKKKKNVKNAAFQFIEIFWKDLGAVFLEKSYIVRSFETLSEK